MPALKNSASSRASKARPSHLREAAAAFALLAAYGAIVAWWLWSRGYSYYFGDAEAHLNIARRIFDSRTPGGSMIGTVWLPLPHLLFAVFAQSDALWTNGLAGVIPSVLCFALAGTLVYLLGSKLFDSEPGGAAAALLFANNPTMMYLATAPMTEPVMAVALCALLLTTLWYRETQSVAALLGVAAALNAAALTRYEGWFLIPFVGLYVLVVGRNKQHGFVFGILAAVAPVAWLAHNQFYYGDALAFYRGPYSANAITQGQLKAGMANPAAGDWHQTGIYYGAVLRHVLGWPLIGIGCVGGLVALFRRAFWPVALLALPGAFYLWSIHSGGTPVFVPELEPYTRYNTRFGLALLPLLAFGGGAIVSTLPRRGAWIAAVILTGATLFGEGHLPVSISWEEARDGSAVRKVWTAEAAAYLRENYRPGAGLIFSFGDLTGVLREAGIPFRETVFQDNRSAWEAAMDRDSALQSEEWALARTGDAVDRRMHEVEGLYRVVHRIEVKGEPAVLIYRRN